MAIRHIIIAAFMASACAAHADVISSKTSSASAQSGFLSGWTTSNGASVLGSGALSSNLSLIGGVAYGSSADQASALMTQASASMGANGQTKLFYTKGIEGQYLLGSGHGILAAMLGNSVSVVGSDNGVIVGTGSAGGLGTGVSGSTGADSGVGLLKRAADVPEPSSIALMLIGLAGAGALTRRRSR